MQQNANVVSIVYPGGKFVSSYTYSFAASPITVGQSGTFQLNLNDAGDYPVRIVALNAQTDSGQTLTPSESMPQELDPDSQQQFTFQLEGSNTNSIGTHSLTLQLGFQVLTTGGWSSQTEYRTLSANYEVTSAPLLPQQTYIQTLGIPLTQNVPTSPPIDFLMWSIVAAILVLALIIGLNKASKSSRKHKEML